MSAALAIAVDTAETTALSRWDALAADIAIGAVLARIAEPAEGGANRQLEAAKRLFALRDALLIQEAERAGDLERSIEAALQKLTREQVAAAIVAGTLHPAVKVDWA